MLLDVFICLRTRWCLNWGKIYLFGRTDWEVARVVVDTFDLIVLESLFMCPRMQNNRLGRSNSISWWIFIWSSVNPHLAKSRLILLSDAIVETSITMAQHFTGQYSNASILVLYPTVKIPLPRSQKRQHTVITDDKNVPLWWLINTNVNRRNMDQYKFSGHDNLIDGFLPLGAMRIL